MPYFSVIIPLYNKENYVNKTLQSILSQTFTDFEIIIINDGSTDNSIEEVKKTNDPRIKLYNQTNQGLSGARNSGIKKATANYIAFIDADDFWLPHHLEQLHNLINNYPDKGLYCTGYTIQKSTSVFHRAHFNELQENFKGIVPCFFKHSLQNCVAWVSAICIPKDVFNDIGYFDLEIFSEQDIDLYIRIATKYEVALDNTSVSAIYNRTMEDGISNALFKKNIPKFVFTYKNIEKNHPALKKYIDYNRFSLAVSFKLASNNKLSKILIEDINFNNLNSFQKLLIYLPNPIIKFLFFIKNKLNLNALFIFKPKTVNY
ncbi:glycosyltransferase family 2 protein [Mariniflexile litorale]|uniref:Glycosyltransferase family 2 protein n=1 Tax=Mariniflexile litorale TaxID=3045158 RepID=A0AAU7EC63_9FLAO|nr:glycosyltransferase family 2 protein [Mariniflexile sp. KMM 9835]MDQ8210411.1 glycosyltransferase family 2 protein [Mariniflexile sp. KMM 9835]